MSILCFRVLMAMACGAALSACGASDTTEKSTSEAATWGIELLSGDKDRAEFISNRYNNPGYARKTLCEDALANLRLSVSLDALCVTPSPVGLDDFDIETASIRQTEFEACGITSAEHGRLMELTIKDFDQNLAGGGWRNYANRGGCKNVTAELIKDYIIYSRPYPPKNIGMLRWHAGQMKASAGRYEEAIKLFKGTYHAPGESQEWNYYVDATIGFLEDDKAKVAKAYEDLSAFEIPPGQKAAMQKYKLDNPQINFPPGFGEEPSNLRVVKQLLDCFGQPYPDAYGKCEASKNLEPAAK